MPEWKWYQARPIRKRAYLNTTEQKIETLEGTMIASVGDYIVEGVHGEHYPVKPDIFEKTYESCE